MHKYFVFLMTALCVMGCGKSNPLCPCNEPLSRFVQGFSDPIELFSGENNYTDADVSAIVYSLDGLDPAGGNQGFIWEQEGYNWSAATSCEQGS